MIAAAIVAATELMRMSRCLTCASSWAITPSSSSGPSARRMPSVAATAACCGLRPVANAFGELSGMMYTRGIGSPARCASRATVAYSGCPAPTSCARYIAQDDLVREEVRHEVGARGEHEGEQQALRAAQRLADEEQQRAERREQQRRLQCVRHGCVRAGVLTTPANLYRARGAVLRQRRFTRSRTARRDVDRTCTRRGAGTNSPL